MWNTDYFQALELRSRKNLNILVRYRTSFIKSIEIKGNDKFKEKEIDKSYPQKISIFF